MSQEEVKPLKEDQFFVVVDQFLDHPETGELIVKQPVFRTKFCALNRPAFTDRGGIAHSPLKVMIAPDVPNGVYYVNVSAGFSGEKSAIMLFQMKRYPKKIIGPFRTQQEALLAKHAARPKTTNEHVGHLQIENSAKEEELVALRARLASLEKGGKPPPQTTPKDK
tara:strand:- start:718 stop:1215 length:498 start_codon:yes stop_codon:yes gene_type:complete